MSEGLPNRYEDLARIDGLIEANRHRQAVGGLWDEIGALQLDAIRQSGLEPHHTVLDAAAGSLRLGRHLVDRLEAGHYFATDLHASLLEAGYGRELSDAQRARLPKDNLRAARVEDAVPFEKTFDRIMAWSLFTHLPVDTTKAGISSLADALAPDGVLLATFFVCDADPALPQRRKHGVVTYPASDPYHVTAAQIDAFAAAAGLTNMGPLALDHPRGQSVYLFRKKGSQKDGPHAGLTDKLTADPSGEGAAPTVCVLGMHRSGTSLLAGSLESAGVHFGEVNTAAQHNKKGNRENIPIRTLNDAILKRHGYDWKTPPALSDLPLAWTDEERAEGRACLQALRGDQATVTGFKDPRTIWTLEGWLELDPTLAFIGVFRQPGAVVASLTRREGALAISHDDALELWRRTNRRLLALIRTRRFPLLNFDPADMQGGFFAPMQDALRSLGMMDARDVDSEDARATDGQDFFDGGLVHNDQARLTDAMAASVYSELLREMGRGRS